ncbi:hypothetical protein J2T12_000678 [Paenibacillus anaericanus]|uniref:DUF7408 domain-containing protein n=1 Tax=Paenibacillus anaericanus TaxID=170367 RepID=UPI0027870973|nr:hypothetical protein [Paenibacillus anaericanus]MDQ0087284.1 hypothetical protein [Paenibacillus anaericanus]
MAKVLLIQKGENHLFLPHVKRITSLVSLWLAVMIILAGVLPQSAYAAQPAISIQSEMGYNGYIKDGEWNPLTITLKSDVDVSGEIVVQTEYSYINGSGSYVKKVDLPAGTSKKVILGIPGASFNKGNNTIRFYKGTAQSGEYIPFTVGQSYLASSATASTLIGVLAQDPDSLNFLKTLNQQSQGRDLTVIPLNGEQIPDDSTLLDPLDIIVVNNFSTDSLSSKQITAIRSWVVKGGTLVLAGGSGYVKTVKGLEDISPVEYIGQTDVTSLPQLAIIGGDKPLKFESPFPISQAKPKDGANVSLQAGEDPLFASWLVGKGEVHYAAYDVAMEPLNSWSGHGEVWSTELGQKLSILPNLQGIYGSQSGFMSGFDYILDYFPSLTLPPFSLLVWLLLAYAILVAPILYYVLKKLDKREWAWLFIPLIAVLASGGIYIAGTSGKSSILAHNISIMELDGKGHANRIAGSALFVPRAGDYNLEFAAGTHLLVGREDGLLSGGQTGGPDRQYISVQDEKTTLKLKDMTHRSMAKMWLDTPETREFGKVDIDISYDDQGNPMGNITNNTTSDLSNAALILGGKVFILGDLPKNKSLSIPAATSMPNYGDYGSTLFPYGVSYGNIDEWERERGIINNYFGRSNATVNNVFLAWNKDKLSDYKVDGKSVASEDLNMWVQSVSPKFEANGNVNIPYGLISGSASSTTANELSANGPGRVQMSEGETVFDYILPKDESIEYSYLAIMQSDINGAMTTEFWNNDSEEWEVLSWNNGKVEFNENINSYINAGGILQIRITTTDWSNFALPEISLKGRK